MMRKVPHQLDKTPQLTNVGSRNLQLRTGLAHVCVRAHMCELRDSLVVLG